METLKLNEILQLLDRVSMDINSVEVQILHEEMPEWCTLKMQCAALWSRAYNIKMEFVKIRDNQMIAESESNSIKKA